MVCSSAASGVRSVVPTSFSVAISLLAGPAVVVSVAAFVTVVSSPVMILLRRRFSHTCP